MSVDLRRAPPLEEVTLPVKSVLSQINLAAGASVDLDAANVPLNTTAKLLKVHVASSVAAKWEIRTRVNGVVATHDIIITEPGSYPWTPPDEEFIAIQGGAASNFRITVTNRDAFNAADVYATVYWDEE